MPQQQQKAKNKGRKIGRWKRKPSYKRYLAERRWIKNKAKGIVRFMRKHPKWKPDNLSADVEAMVYRLTH
jgi:hypothetical protein